MKRLFTIATVFVVVATVFAQVQITTYNYSAQCLLGMSNNGHWGLLYAADENTESAKIINLETKQVENLQTEEEIAREGRGVVADVSDDGNIIVGAYKGYPAFFNRAEKTWTILQSGKLAGLCHAVTPDGRYAVGVVNDGEIGGEEVSWYNSERAVMWDLTTAEEVAIPENLIPARDPRGDKIAYMRFIDVSPDGRYLLARTLTFAEYFTLLIDREENTSMFVGYEQNGSQSYTPVVKDLYFLEPTGMSPNGKWVVGNGYFVEETGGEFPEEYGAPVRYNIETGEVEAFNQSTDDHDIYTMCVDNDGNLYGASPSGSPVREFYIRNEKYWYSLRSVLSRKYGIDFAIQTALDNTGTPCGVSDDGRTFISMVDPQFGQNFCLQTTESLVEICSGMNLLGVYTVSPAEGSIMAKMNKFRITFDREVEVIGDQTAASFGEWNSVSNNGISVDPTDSHTIIITFRSRELTPGEEYHLTVPAGVISIKGDRSKTNEEIVATYVGRANEPVAPSTVYPASGSVLAKIDNSSSPVFMQYPYGVSQTETASAALYTDDDDSRICNLQVYAVGNTVYLFPTTTQYLYAGIGYYVKVEAGSLTDVSGNGANEAMKIYYTGSYEREISSDNVNIFSDDFNNFSVSLANWLMYDNDHRSPADEMAEMEFDADNTPWNFSIHDSFDSPDYAAASHSMYKPAGQSDDWLVTPQLYIPDEKVTLSFDAQSMLKSKTDRLKVLIWECEYKINIISRDAFEMMTDEAKLVFDEILSPGAEEQTLAGDWKNYVIDLADYAGKSIYIAFVNQNDDQSMVFIDNVKVIHNKPYLLTLANKQSVVGETETQIAGKLTVNTENGLSGGFFLTLCDAEGQTVDTYDYRVDKVMEKNEVKDFAFVTPLPLTIGKENKFSITIEFRDGVDAPLTTEEVKSSIKSLSFLPTKHVVLEEMTGSTCGNCPLGIIAIEKMKELYGEQFIPVSIHAYGGDQLGTGIDFYASELGLNAAPTAIVQRSSDILMPMLTDPATSELTLSYNGELWMDYVAEEFNRETEVDIQAEIIADDDATTFSLPISVRSALDVESVNYNVFVVLLEDNILGYQLNYFSSQTDAALGEWAQGGIYGKSRVNNYLHNDVARCYYGPSVYGVSGLLPQSLEAGETYTTDAFADLPLPGTIEDVQNAKLAVILIDANTDRIVNACQVKFGKGAGITSVDIDNANAPAFNLAGQRVSSYYKGMVVRKGRKAIIH